MERAATVLLDHVEELVQEVADAIGRADIYHESGVAADDLRSAHRANLVALLNFLSGNPGAGLAAPRATGELRGGQGTSLPAVLRAYRLGAGVVWDRLLAMAGGNDTAQAELLASASDAWRILDDYTQAVTVSYQETVAEQARRDAAIRGAALDAILTGAVDGARLWDCATTLRLPQTGSFVVVVAALPDHTADEAPPGVDAQLTALGARSIWRLQVDRQVGVIALSGACSVDRLCTIIATCCATASGVSTPYTSLGNTHLALRQAQLACAAAGSGIQRAVRYENALVPALLASAPEVAGALTAAVLGPVLAMPAQDRDMLIETLRCWFDSNGEITAVARELYCHRNTVRSRLNRITDATGCDVATPAGTARLYLALEAHRVTER